MKYLVISDIHGDLAFINYIFKLIETEQPDKIILLGDMMSLGDDSRRILDLIDEYRNKLVLIQGNCDYPSFFNDNLLKYYRETINGKVFIFTHGHLMSSNTIENDVYVYGHTHMNELEEVDNHIFFNPGSIARPRGNSTNSYGLITDDELIIKDVDNNVIKKLTYRK